ncbi:MAG: hypothetical protein FJ290_26865 [Planctomycetes bacterium]|nr:hypothetical protein [Planctomycetota bacterium]
MSRLRYVPLALGLLMAFGPAASACSIPVFRYALERWPAAPYLAVVFHKGPLKAEEQKLVEALRQAAGGDAPANLEVQAVDVEGKLDKSAEAIWKGEKPTAMPWAVLLYPYELRIEQKAWAGPLAAQLSKGLVDSPVRRAVVNGLAAGNCAVWVLVESGDKAKDDAAAKLIAEELKKLEKTLELPAPDMFGGPAEDAFTPEARQALKVAFTMVRVSRADKAEEGFLDCLLGVDAELKAEKRPMAFAIFGQGRALPCLIGDGINEDNVGGVCAFICGPCSCQVKAMNPGWDLLIAADWSAAIEGRLVKDPEVPALTGSVSTPLPKEEAAPKTPPAEPAPAPAASGKGERVLLRNIVIAAVAALILIGVASAVFLRRRDG